MIAGATAESFGQCLPILLEAEEVDLVIVTFVPPIMVNPLDVVGAVSAVKRGYDKPVFMILMAEDQYFLDIPRQIPDCPPIYHYPEVAAYTAAEMANYADIAAREEGIIPEIDAERETARGDHRHGAAGRGVPRSRRRRSVCSRPTTSRWHPGVGCTTRTTPWPPPTSSATPWCSRSPGARSSTSPTSAA